MDIKTPETYEEWTYLFHRTTDQSGEKTSVCRFSCPFIQKRLYNALTDDLIGDRLPMLAVDPLDDLADVFEGETLNLPSLLDRYKAYLKKHQKTLWYTDSHCTRYGPWYS